MNYLPKQLTVTHSHFFNSRKWQSKWPFAQVHLGPGEINEDQNQEVDCYNLPFDPNLLRLRLRLLLRLERQIEK